jgi:hypothetical protein
MSFIDLKQRRRKYPRRLWAVFGEADTGKSTLCAQLKHPLVWIDADQRADEIVDLVEGRIYGISDSTIDNVSPDRIDSLLTQGMASVQAGTIVIDSVTAILEPIIGRIMADIEAGRVKNKAGAWRPKAMAMRMLHNLQRFGTGVVMVYHEFKSLDADGKWHQARTISELEEARMLKSLNMMLRTFREDERFGLEVMWARNGRSGVVLYDETGRWQGMPERIEAAVYDDLTENEQVAFDEAPPEGSFPSVPVAIAWGYARGVFEDEAHAQNAYAKLKKERKPQTALEMRNLWVAEVQARVTQKEADAEATQGSLFDASDDPDQAASSPA